MVSPPYDDLWDNGLRYRPLGPCIFASTESDLRKRAILADDITLYGPDKLVSRITRQLKARFRLSEVDKLHCLFGIQVTQNEGVNGSVISLSQGRYVDKVFFFLIVT